METEIASEKLRKGQIEDYEWQQLLHKTDQLNNAKIFIDDSPALSILELRAKSRRLKSQHGIQCIIVDYLQLMSGEYGKTTISLFASDKGNPINAVVPERANVFDQSLTFSTRIGG
mgnify:CR=1 FL=1